MESAKLINVSHAPKFPLVFSSKIFQLTFSVFDVWIQAMKLPKIMETFLDRQVKPQKSGIMNQC